MSSEEIHQQSAGRSVDDGTWIESAPPPFGVRDVLTVLFKRKAAIVATFCVVFGAMVVVTFALAPSYQSEAKLLVKFGRENIYRPEVGDDKTTVLQSNSEEVLNSEINILTSRDLVERVLTTLTVAEVYPALARHPPSRGTPLDAAVERFTRDLSVDGIRKSNVIQLGLENENPRTAARALGLLVDAFKEKHLQAYSDPKSSYLEQQLTSYEQRLNQSQERLEAFKQEHRVYSIDEQRTLLLRQRADLDSALKTTESQIKEDEKKLASLQHPLDTISPDVPLSTDSERYRGVDDAKSQLLALQLKEQDLLRKYTESNPLVVSVRQEIAIVQGFIKTQEEDLKGRIRTGQNVIYQDVQRDVVKLQAELPSLQAKAASLREQIAGVDRDLPALDQTQMDLDNLQRDVSVNDQNYRTYRSKVEDALTLEDLNRRKSANITVIQEATVPVKPVRPKKALNLAIGLGLGLLSGLGLAFALEIASQGLSTPESVERRLGLPVLVTVPFKK
jgi:uncharacterized protein involved in exopolysaccharide biosynthesis